MPRTFIYVSCAVSRTVDVFSLDTRTGQTELRQRLSLPANPSPIRISPDGRLLLVGLQRESALMVCTIDRTEGSYGRLSIVGDVPLPGAPVYVNSDHSARHAFVTSYADNLLAVIPLDADGHPVPAVQVETGLPRAHAAVVDGSGQWLLTPTLGDDAIRRYRLTPDAHLVPGEPPLFKVRAGSGPRHLLFSSDNRRVHCLNELDGSVDLFDFDAETGQLDLRQSMRIMPPGFTEAPWSAELRVTPNGAFLYTCERRSSTLTALAVDVRNGQLSLLGHYPTETQPRGMAIDPSGRWLAVAGQLSGHLSLYALDPATGHPELCTRIATGDDPICVDSIALP